MNDYWNAMTPPAPPVPQAPAMPTPPAPPAPQAPAMPTPPAPAVSGMPMPPVMPAVPVTAPTDQLAYPALPPLTLVERGGKKLWIVANETHRGWNGSGWEAL